MKQYKFMLILSLITLVVFAFLHDQKQSAEKNRLKIVEQSSASTVRVEVKDLTLEQLMQIPVSEGNSTPESN